MSLEAERIFNSAKIPSATAADIEVGAAGFRSGWRLTSRRKQTVAEWRLPVGRR